MRIVRDYPRAVEPGNLTSKLTMVSIFIGVQIKLWTLFHIGGVEVDQAVRGEPRRDLSEKCSRV
jgi:hypothetical protein